MMNGSPTDPNAAQFGSVGDPFIMMILSEAGGADGLREGAALHLADQFVVEGDVRVDRPLGQTVVGDDGDIGVLGLLHLGAMTFASTASSRMMSTLSSIIRCIWVFCFSVDAAALAYSVLPLPSVSSETFSLDDGVVELLVPRVRLLRQQQPHRDVVALRRGSPSSLSPDTFSAA